jgi:hypothetical protein
MQRFSREQVTRVLLTVAILLSGVAMVPFIELPAQADITWQSLAGVYEPELRVNAPVGRPGSVFAFTGSNYPPNSLATVYVNGEPLGTVMTNDEGVATFMIDTTGAAVGQYNVTLEVDINASATTSIELVADGPVITPPFDFEGPTFYLAKVLYLPIIFKE